MAKKLQGLSSNFRASQKDYMARVKDQKGGGGTGGAFDFLSGGGGAGRAFDFLSPPSFLITCPLQFNFIY